MKIFEYKAGSNIEKISKTTLTATNLTHSKTEKGVASFFNAVNTTLTTGVPAYLNDMDKEFTISFAIKITQDQPVIHPRISEFRIDANNGLVFALYSNEIHCSMRNKGTYTSVRSSLGSVPTNNYILITLVKSGVNTLRLYVNNTPYTAAGTSFALSSENALGIGCTSTSVGIKCFMLNYRIYDTALTAQEQSVLYEEFLRLDIKEKEIRGFEYPKPTDLSYLKDTGLVAAYNMIPNGNTLVDISGNCLHPDTRLFTSNGWKKAKDLDYDDEIYQSNGQFGEIKNIFISERDEEIIKLKGRVVPEIKLTKEHRVLSAGKDKVKQFRLTNNNLKWENKEKKDFDFTPEWKEAQELQVGDYLVLPKPVLKEEEQLLDFFKHTSLTNKIRYYVENKFELNDILEDLKIQRMYEDGKYNTEYRNIIDKKHQLLAGKLIDKPIIPKDIKLDKDLAILFGWYLAEGCTSTDYDICFSLHKDEQKERDELKRILKEKFNLSSWECKGNGRCITLNANSKFLSDFLNDHFNKGARNKEIPQFIKEAPKEIIIEFLKAYCAGDGYISKSSDRHPSYVSWQSSSNKIIQDLVLVLMKLGIVPTVNRANKEGEKQFLDRTIYSYDSWDVRVTNKDVEIFGVERTAKTEQQYYLEDENNFYIPITKIATEYYKGEVYDFETDTHTLGMPFIIHNSNNGTINGALRTKDGMSFNGLNNYIQLKTSVLSNITLSLRFKTSSSSRQSIIAGALDRTCVFINNGVIGSGNALFAGMATTKNTYKDGLWHSLTVIKTSANTYRFFIDGVEDSGGSNAGYRAATEFQIGGVNNSSVGETPTLHFNGEISDIRIYNRELTQAEIIAYHNSFIKPVLIESFSNYAVGDTL